MNIGIIGLGLIGGSFGKALVKKTQHMVYGYDISYDTLLKSQIMPCVHEVLNEESYPILDVLVIAVNPRDFINVMNQTAPLLREGCIIIDIGGNKKSVVRAMKITAKNYPHLNFVATHPMAGREFYGINHSLPSLFDKASILFIPAVADIKSLVTLKGLLLEIGFSNVILTNEDVHDEIIAYTSQLAHIISSSYVQSPTATRHDGFSAGSFRDLTRVAKMNAAMWTELITDNSANVLKELNGLIDRLNDFKQAIEKKDESKLFELFENGNKIKENIEKASREWKKINE